MLDLGWSLEAGDSAAARMTASRAVLLFAEQAPGPRRLTLRSEPVRATPSPAPLRVAVNGCEVGAWEPGRAPDGTFEIPVQCVHAGVNSIEVEIAPGATSESPPLSLRSIRIEGSEGGTGAQRTESVGIGQEIRETVAAAPMPAAVIPIDASAPGILETHVGIKGRAWAGSAAAVRVRLTLVTSKGEKKQVFEGILGRGGEHTGRWTEKSRRPSSARMTTPKAPAGNCRKACGERRRILAC